MEIQNTNMNTTWAPNKTVARAVTEIKWTPKMMSQSQVRLMGSGVSRSVTSNSAHGFAYCKLYLPLYVYSCIRYCITFYYTMQITDVTFKQWRCSLLLMYNISMTTGYEKGKILSMPRICILMANSTYPRRIYALAIVVESIGQMALVCICIFSDWLIAQRCQVRHKLCIMISLWQRKKTALKEPSQYAFDELHEICQKLKKGVRLHTTYFF